MTSLSVVVTVYNGALTIRELTARLAAVLPALAEDYELIFVEDNGPDNSWEVICQLAGVSSNAGGKGLGKLMVNAALAWFVNHQVYQISVVTQGRNIKAQRLYQRCGFITRQVQLWYHWWPTKGVDRP